MSTILIGDFSFRIAEDGCREDLRDFAKRFKPCDLEADVVVRDVHGTLQLEWNRQGQVRGDKQLKLFIDIDKFVSGLTSFPAAKQGAFNQAIGKKTRSVLDCTGGWGGDALLMAAQGYRVTVLERHPLMALLLSDAFRRLAASKWAEKHDVFIPQIIEADAGAYLTRQMDLADCLYLDPMFPPKRKKSAAANKYMEFLKWLLAAEPANDELASSAVKTNSRVVVKRPHHAAPLIDVPDVQFSGKLVNYDVYLPSAS